GRTIDVDLVLARAVLEELAAPLVERTLDVCRRLFEAHGAAPVTRVVLVGGPTVMPFLRARVEAALGPLAPGIDPMTLVARAGAPPAAGRPPRPPRAPTGARPVPRGAARRAGGCGCSTRRSRRC